MRETGDIFNELIGEQLSSVTFVQDYLQLDFDGNRLTLYVWPTVKSNGAVWGFDDSNYRNELCAMIAKKVKSTSLVESTALRLTFADDAEIHISLKGENPEINGPEILNYTNTKNDWIVI